MVDEGEVSLSCVQLYKVESDESILYQMQYRGQVGGIAWVGRWPVCDIDKKPNLLRLFIRQEISLQSNSQSQTQPEKELVPSSIEKKKDKKKKQ